MMNLIKLNYHLLIDENNNICTICRFLSRSFLDFLFKKYWHNTNVRLIYAVDIAKFEHKFDKSLSKIDKPLKSI